jgi:hypothetical protein
MFLWILGKKSRDTSDIFMFSEIFLEVQQMHKQK